MARITVGGVGLHYEDEGDGPALLLLHGWGTSGRVWGAQLPDLTRDHRVVTVDWRGCGRSDRPAGGNTIDRNVEDVIAVIAELGLGRTTVVGNSMGATFAVEVALRRPDLVSSVVAVDAPGHWARGMAAMLAELRQALVRDRPAALEGWVSHWYGPAVGAGMVQWTVRQILESGPYIDALLTEHGTYDPRPALPSLEVPATFVHGRLDSEIPLAVAEELAALVPDGRVRVIEGSGHLPHQEQPEAFADALRGALTAAGAGGATSAVR